MPNPLHDPPLPAPAGAVSGIRFQVVERDHRLFLWNPRLGILAEGADFAAAHGQFLSRCQAMQELSQRSGFLWPPRPPSPVRRRLARFAGRGVLVVGVIGLLLSGTGWAFDRLWRSLPPIASRMETAASAALGDYIDRKSAELQALDPRERDIVTARIRRAALQLQPFVREWHHTFGPAPTCRPMGEPR
ncbi:MAG: hypothetical protein HQL82_05360 [Magnetococcales bacterium]|nr:hypothetical protein [Magnetococcales bacterium]